MLDLRPLNADFSAGYWRSCSGWMWIGDEAMKN